MKKPVPAHDEAPKRRNRAVAAGEAIAGALDPMLKRRGFASRDILAHWRAMAPKPYDTEALPDRLAWPRGERGAAGATLYLRCSETQRLALAHEGPRVAAAVNRYFGYVLVEQVRLSAMPFSPGSAAKPEAEPTVTPERRAAIGRAVRDVADERLRTALAQLGLAIAAQKR